MCNSASVYNQQLTGMQYQSGQLARQKVFNSWLDLMDQSNICMKTWIVTLSLELVHPLLLQALVLIRKKDPTVLIPILILLSLPSRRFVES